MLVEEIMTREVITIGADRNLMEAREAMMVHNLRRLPVTDDIMRLKGIVTDGDVGRSQPSDVSLLSKHEANYLLGRIKVRDIMTKNVVTVHAGDSVEMAAYQLYRYRINALPVIDDNFKVVGIVSDSDVFKVFFELMGYNQTSTRITLEVKDQVGVLASVAEIFRDRGINILSLITREKGEGITELILRADLTGAMDVVEELRKAGFNITDISTFKQVG